MDQITKTVKKVLDDFFPNDDEFEFLHVDEEDKTILSQAISDAVKKVVTNESKN